ncbi:hypothetical protein HHX48_15345 [Salinimonas sp. HHU 13199]|uniref:Tetratricopeptide repeat protein n=1 Tax=Salinimonas profundi TaxID=2729140 RepID=A0ABR8LSK8_9ALTE|nr:hypothetical protein [Salinimonas profundi]MBD3587120.1 hypothetical protein [Salinimonas profundi]
MEDNENVFVARANYFFANADYVNAEKYYELAQEKIGKKYFSTNIWLCQQRLLMESKDENSFLNEIISPSFNDDTNCTNSELSAQLEETQNLLEKYYKEALDLKTKLTELRKK